MRIDDRFGTASTLSEPFDYFRELRTVAPVFWSDALKAYVVTSAEAVHEVLVDPARFSSSSEPSAEGLALMAEQYRHIYEDVGACSPFPTLLVTDGDPHRRYRKAIVELAFAPAAVRRLETNIAEIASDLIDRFIDAGQVDVFTEFCLKLPSFVICDLVGFPRSAAALLKKGADTSARLTSGASETEEDRIQLHRDRAEMHLYFQSLIRQYREHPEDNLLSRLIAYVPDDGVAFTDQELVSMAGALNVGGNETTTNGLGNMFLRAFQDPALQENLRSDPGLIDRFIEEVLRLESPVSAMIRRVAEDTVLQGEHLAKGSRLFVSFLSANHDERRYSCPAALDMSRKGARNHSAFGEGLHYCVGAALARVELKIGMQSVLARMSDIALTCDPGTISHRGHLINRSLSTLPIRFVRAA
jgi:cytochrome P450